jgi:hypothetical protein
MASPYMTEPEPRKPLRTCLPSNDDRQALIGKGSALFA